MKLLASYLGLCFFINNPVDLQPHKSFIQKVIAFYLISGVIVEGLIADFADGTLEVSMRITMAFASISFFLWLIKRWDFFKQLFTAIFVCENFIITLAIATEVLYLYMQRQKYEYYENVSKALGVFLLIWYLLAIAYILRRSFPKYRFSESLAFSFSYLVLTYGIPMMFMDM